MGAEEWTRIQKASVSAGDDACEVGGVLVTGTHLRWGVREGLSEQVA